MKAYKIGIKPVPSTDDQPTTNYKLISLPIITRKPGRLKNRRIREQENPKPTSNYKINRKGLIMTYGNYGVKGHNVRRCPNPKNPNSKKTKIKGGVFTSK